MSINLVFIILATVASAFYLGVLLYASYRARVKRELYLLKALIMLYFVVLSVQRLTGYTYLSISRLFVPVLTALFVTQAISTLVDAYRRS